jgi:hypothetical protein
LPSQAFDLLFPDQTAAAWHDDCFSRLSNKFYPSSSFGTKELKMKHCIDCGQELVAGARRCDKCMTIQPNYGTRLHRTGVPYLILRWVALTLLVAVAWGILGFDADETIVFAIAESGFAAAIIIVMDQLLDHGL